DRTQQTGRIHNHERFCRIGDADDHTIRYRPFAETRAKLHDLAADRLVETLNHCMLLLIRSMMRSFVPRPPRAGRPHRSPYCDIPPRGVRAPSILMRPAPVTVSNRKPPAIPMFFQKCTTMSRCNAASVTFQKSCPTIAVTTV